MSTVSDCMKVPDRVIVLLRDELNYLSGVFTKAIEWYKATLNPVRRIKRFRGVERKRILERWEQKALIYAAADKTMPPHLLPLLIFDLNTGLVTIKHYSHLISAFKKDEIKKI
jgi:hypothetical protein